MSDRRNVTRGVLLTFFIGFMAGISPFIFMQVLPSLMNPDVPFKFENYFALLLTGTLIGTITSIIYSTKYEPDKSQQIFFNALGIPAILIATISNLSIEFNAENTVSEVIENASYEVQQQSTPIESSDITPERLQPQHSLNQSFHLGIATFADEVDKSEDFMLAQAGFLVIIGEYAKADDAWAAYNKYINTRFRTERYAPKNLGVYKITSVRFVLVYGMYGTREEADRVYKLLRINDPNIYARLMKY